MRVGCVQLNSSANPADNLDAASTLIRAAAADGARLVATPEMTGLMQRKPNDLWAAIKTQDEDIGVAGFAALAKELGIFVLIGSLAILVGDKRAANRSFLFTPKGHLQIIYDKIHLFDAVISRSETYRESNVYDGGAKAVTADVDDFTLGLSICYDVRFAALYRKLALAGANILTVPAAFTRPTGEAHWEVLLRSRAIETGSYVIAPAQGGDHEDGRSTWGHSLIIDPWGKVIAQLAHDRPGFVCADLDLEAIASARRKIPAWKLETGYARP